MENRPFIRVRPAVAEDVEFLVVCNEALARESENLSLNEDQLRRGVQAIFTDPAKGFYLIAEWEGQPVGQLLITYEWSDWRNGTFWWIQSVYTVPEKRRRGVFRALYTAVEALAKEAAPVCGLRLYVAAENESAQATYLRSGMRESHYRLFEAGLGGLGEVV